MPSERIEVELAIKNAGIETLQKMSATFRDLLGGIQNIGKAGESTGSTGIARSIQGVQKLTIETKEAAANFDFMSKTMLAMARK
jgi:hypothetical protein